MKISLKEARRIERRIQEKGLRKGYPLRANINIYSDENIEDEIDAAAEKAQNNVLATVELIHARSVIRRLIQQTNETSGINELIAKREEYIRLITIWNDVSETGEDIKQPEIIVRTIEAARKRAEAGADASYYAKDTVQFTAISDKLYDIAAAEVRNKQRLIDKCDDELAGLNATTKIELSERIQSLLEEHDII